LAHRYFDIFVAATINVCLKILMEENQVATPPLPSINVEDEVSIQRRSIGSGIDL